jgi:hypothetical protein
MVATWSRWPVHAELEATHLPQTDRHCPFQNLETAAAPSLSRREEKFGESKDADDAFESFILPHLFSFSDIISSWLTI